LGRQQWRGRVGPFAFASPPPRCHPLAVVIPAKAGIHFAVAAAVAAVAKGKGNNKSKWIQRSLG
jgi:hypothetical protein